MAELYAGIGGCAAALDTDHSVVVAVEQSDVVLSVYRANFAHRTLEKNIVGIRADEARAWGADLWWMSPPCQSFTVRGRQRDLEDSRAKSFLRLLELIDDVRPERIALENVPPFRESEARARLFAVLERGGYHVRERILCPTELGIPNLRQRYYLIASQRALTDGSATPAPLVPRTIADFVEPDEALGDEPALWVTPALLSKYEGALQILEAGDPRACASCFTAAYGRSPVRSGPYLRTERGVRRFSPKEIARMLGFPEGYGFPPGMGLQKRWSLLGNSVSVHAVRAVLRPLLEA